MNLDQANAQAVLLDESVTYRLPELNSADALVFFGRDPNDKNVPDGYGRLLRLARGAQKLETIGEVPISLNGLLWAPGGSLLVAFQGGVIALYDPSTGLGFPLPMTDLVAYAWGPTNQPAVQAAPTALPAVQPTEIPAEQATQSSVTLIPVVTQSAPQTTPLPVSTVTALTLSDDAFFLAPDSRGIVQVWKMPRGGTPPQPFTGSGSDVNEFAVSPDGHTVAYVVDAELWLQQDVQQPKLLARINSFAPVEAAFSADATRIAYVDERSGVWIDVIADNAPQLIRANNNGETYHRPQYSPDGNSLMVDVYGSSGTAIGVLNLATRDLLETTPAAADDPRPVQTRWLQDGRIYSYVDANTPSSVAPGFYILDAGLSNTTPAQWIPIPASVTVRASIEAVGGSLRVLTAGGTEAFSALSVTDYDLSSGESKPLMSIGSLIAPQISPDGRFVGGYESLTQIDGIQQGAILVVDLATGRRFQLSNPATAWGFRWAAP
jgi:WD40 repeat protein